VLLHIELPPEWPRIAPSIKLKEADDVKPHVRDRIRRLLKTVKPNIDIYTICDSLQDVMEDAAESKLRRQAMPALDEERTRKEADALRKAEAEEHRLAREKQEQQAQATATMTTQVKNLQLKQRVIGTTESDEAYQTQYLNLPNPVVHFDEIMSLDEENGRETKFRDVWGTFVVLKTEEKKVTIVTPVVANDVTPRRLLLKEIHLDASIVPHPSQLLKDIVEVEILLKDLKMHRHESVVDVFGYKVVTIQDPDSGVITGVVLTILSAFANKGSLAETLDIYDPLGGKRIMSWTTQLLEALAFFDDLGYAHPAVHLNNILLFRAPAGRITVQLSDGYGTDLRKLVMQARLASGIEEPSIPAGWRAPELNKSQPTRSEKTCIWDLGVVVMQMISGKEVLNNYTSPNDYLKTNNTLTDDLYDMLTLMCALDQSARPKAYDLTSCEFLRGDGTLFISTTPAGPSMPYYAGRRGSALDEHNSWKSKWEEISLLGKGGFGEVVKARNRDDQHLYAVKKVKCESKEDVIELYNEIKLLAQLNSPRVVRYHNSWDEPDNIQRTDSESSTDFANHSIRNIPSTGHDWVEGADFLSGPGDSRIQFANSSDESEDNKQGYFTPPGPENPENSTDDSDGGVRAAYVQRHIQKPTGPRTLYIVMELCETKSLRSMIKDKKLTTEAEIWRIFGQIVEGLAYIHSKHLIHRDLKPENIFLDERNDIRIGDFGLATRGKISGVGGRSLFNQVTDESRSIGTTLYVAPELKSESDGNYTNKVDMYSLGITFLEMCIPFTTSGGRNAMLSDARKFRLLPDFLSQKGWEQQRKLIYSLLSHVQEERPSAADIIASGVVPQPVGSEKIHQYVMNLLHGDPEAYDEIVEHFFKTKTTPAQDMAWDTNANATEKPHENAFSRMVNQKLQVIFERHGAVDSNRQTIFPVSQLYAKPATFLDRSGITLQLPYDLTLPFARLLARTKVESTRHYAFGVVYRAEAPGGQPPPRSEVSFDVVSYSAKDLSVKEAETLKVLDEILSDFPPLRKSKSIVIFLNHSDLLEMVFRFCRIEPHHWDSLKKLLSSINTIASWKRIENELRSPQTTIPKASIAQLALFNFQGDLQGARKKLEKMFTSATESAKLQQIFARLLEVQNYALKLKVETRILMNPLVNYSESLYRGSIMFQCVDAVEKKTIAVGGRYDHLIQTLGPVAPTHGAARAVGLRLNSTELADRLASELRATNKSTRVMQGPQRCDVLVTSFDELTLQNHCLELAAELWANDIRAELTDHYNSFDELATAYKNEGQYTVLVVRQDSNAIGGIGVRARTIGKQDEEEIKRNELVGWLKGAFKDKQGAEIDQTRGKLRRETSVGEPSLHNSSDARQPAEVIVITPKHKNKKTNRQHLIEEAIILAREKAREFIGGSPIVTVEVTTEVLESFRSTRIGHADTWKTFLQSCPPEETRYLKDVQQKLEELAENGKKGVWILSSKTKAIIYYDLGQSL
jgi:eukaryotic translation initiation factor 2-alpha kinase 4